MNLLSLHYLPCVQWFSKMVQGEAVIEQHEHYVKGSYRNRCHIVGANGVLPLSIPLAKGKNQHKPIREVKISYMDNWQKLHWQSIQSAYGNAPFFEFYADDIRPFFEKKMPFLFDFNLQLLHCLIEAWDLDTSLVSFSDSYTKSPNGKDFRTSISPKPHRQLPDEDFVARPYAQVFTEKHGFLANVSVLDLLFCTGPEGLRFLVSS